jgi:hypothetical protein
MRDPSPPKLVVPGEGGISSTPRFLGSIISVSVILDPPSLCELRRTGHPPRLRVPAACFARVLQIPCPHPRNRGRRECRVRAAPAVSCANSAKKAHTSIQGSGGSPTSPAQWLYDLFRALPGERALLPPSSADNSTNLAPASRRQDHTTSPYALAHSSALARLNKSVHRIPSPTHRDDRETPPRVGRVGETSASDLPDVTSEIFLIWGD